MRALDLLGQALTRDADYGLALAQAASCHMQLSANGWTEDQQRSRQEGVDLARRALRGANDDPNVLVHVAHVLGHLEPDIERRQQAHSHVEPLSRIWMPVCQFDRGSRAHSPEPGQPGSGCPTDGTCC